MGRQADVVRDLDPGGAIDGDLLEDLGAVDGGVPDLDLGFLFGYDRAEVEPAWDHVDAAENDKAVDRGDTAVLLHRAGTRIGQRPADAGVHSDDMQWARADRIEDGRLEIDREVGPGDEVQRGSVSTTRGGHQAAFLTAKNGNSM